MSWHYPPAIGGSENQAERLVRALARRGHQVEVWTSRRPDAPVVEKTAEGATIRRMLRVVNIGPLFRITIIFQTFWRIWREGGRFDVVHSQQGSWGAVGAVLAQMAGGPSVVVRLSSSGAFNDLRLMGSRGGGRLWLWIVRRAAAFVVLCRAARKEIIELGAAPEKIFVFTNGIETGRYGASWTNGCVSLRDDSGRTNGGAAPQTLLYVGRLDPLKGVDVLVRAVGELRRRGSAVRLQIIGEGAEMSKLETLARELGLTLSHSRDDGGKCGAANSQPGPWEKTPRQGASRQGVAPRESPEQLVDLEFLGSCSDPRPYYARAGVVVLPSRTEGMSNVLLEAMAMGCSVVATAVGGNCDLLDPQDGRCRASEAIRNGVFEGENGLLVPPENPEALARGILEMFGNLERARRLGASARRHIESHCSLEAVAIGYEQLYGSLKKR